MAKQFKKGDRVAWEFVGEIRCPKKGETWAVDQYQMYIAQKDSSTARQIANQVSAERLNAERECINVCLAYAKWGIPDNVSGKANSLASDARRAGYMLTAIIDREKSDGCPHYFVVGRQVRRGLGHILMAEFYGENAEGIARHYAETLNDQERP